MGDVELMMDRFHVGSFRNVISKIKAGHCDSGYR
jgi:hypothetical protein